MPKINYRLGIFLMLGFGVATSAHGPAEVCALTIEIADIDDGRPWLAHVLVRDASSRVVADMEADAEGKARIWDLGFGLHTVEVQTPYCHTVSIDKVRFVYPHPLYFKLMLPSCAVSEEGAVIGNACAVYLRVQSEEGKPVGGATVNMYADPKFQEKADSYGRLHTLVPLGDAGSLVTALAPGFEPAQVRVRCAGHMYREQLIVLEKKK